MGKTALIRKFFNFSSWEKMLKKKYLFNTNNTRIFKYKNEKNETFIRNMCNYCTYIFKQLYM